MSSAHVLLVEDNPLTAKGLEYLLEREHYKIAVASSMATAMTMLNNTNFDLILLDVTLPDGNGFKIARQIHQNLPALPMIFLTARDDEVDVIRGFELGASDYVTKPFRNRELIFRIKNALKHQQNETKQVVIGNFTFDLENGELMMNNQNIVLTALERRILSCLAENAGHVVTRERLLDEIWDASGSIVNDNTLSVYLKRLRSKLGQDGIIETVKNLGYRLKLPTEAA